MKVAIPSQSPWTVGGAPAGLGLAVGRLDALVCATPQTIHDTTHVPALLALGVHAVGDVGGGKVGVLNRGEIMSQFNRLHRPLGRDAGERDASYTPIPAMVLTTNLELGERIAAFLAAHPDAQLVCVDNRAAAPHLRIV